MKRINWDDLPHDNIVGHGREGLVLRLDDVKCIKIYSPERSFRAEEEFRNYGSLKRDGFLVPEFHELVEVHIGGRKVKLPGKCEFMGIGLYSFEVESVPGIVKEFFPGSPYGTKKPSIREISGLIKYMKSLHEAGLTFYDGRAADFIASDRGTALVDCSTLVDRTQIKQKLSGGFESASSSYQDRIFSDFQRELDSNGFSGVGLWLKWAMAEWLAK